MLKKSSLLGKGAGRYLLIASLSGMMVACGGGSGDIDPDEELSLGEQDFDFDGTPNAEDEDADGDDLNDFTEDDFVDLDRDGLDDFYGTPEAETVLDTTVQVSVENPCGGQRLSDNDSSNNAWNDNCLVKRSSDGGQFADSLFAAGIQRVLYCAGFAKESDFAEGLDYTDFAEGEFGPASEAATIRFQEAENLVADGVVGPQTWARLQLRAELLVSGDFEGTPDTYGFREGECAQIPMFYQEVSIAADGVDIDRGGWRLARNVPNEAESVPFSYELPFGRL